MKQTLLIITALFVAIAPPGRAQLITGFGSAQLNPINTSITSTDFTPPWTIAQATQTTTTLTVNTVSAFSGGLSETLAAPITLTDTALSTLGLSLKGELLSTAPTGNFEITLYDDAKSSGNLTFANSETFTFAWSSFTQNTLESVVAFNPVEAGSFDGKVAAWEFDVGSGPTETVSFQFDSLTAVPEPSTYAMFGLGAVMLYFVHQRRKARVS